MENSKHYLNYSERQLKGLPQWYRLETEKKPRTDPSHPFVKISDTQSIVWNRLAFVLQPPPKHRFHVELERKTLISHSKFTLNLFQKYIHIIMPQLIFSFQSFQTFLDTHTQTIYCFRIHRTLYRSRIMALRNAGSWDYLSLVTNVCLEQVTEPLWAPVKWDQWQFLPNCHCV